MTSLLLYIDPASTAIIWQVLAGVFITFSVVLGIWWRKISTFIKGLFVGRRKKIQETCDAQKIIMSDYNNIKELEEKIESLNDQGVYDITLITDKIDPTQNYLIDKYGIVFKEANE